MSKTLTELFQVIQERKFNPTADSYTASLFSKGEDQILKKVLEEAGEVVVASKSGRADQVIYESADLLYHLLVLWAYHGISLEAIWDELEKRRK